MGLIGTREELIEKLTALMHQKLHINHYHAQCDRDFSQSCLKPWDGPDAREPLCSPGL